MKFLAVLLPLTAVVLAVPSKRGQCTTPEVRVEWLGLTQEQRDSYHNATKCLQTKPSGVEGQSLYDRFAQNHMDMYAGIHFVAAFLPWHRYYSHVHFRSIKDCGYTGPAVYWDWTKNVENMASSEIFHPTKGFGGSGTLSGDLCVEEGPYSTKSNFTLNSPEKRCLQRFFMMENSKSTEGSPASGPATRHSQTEIDEINQQTSFAGFWSGLEQGPHESIHNEIGGDMTFLFSPADPLFWLHHNNVDRLWALWQGRNSSRLNDYTGNTVPGQNQTDGSQHPLATLDDTIDIGIQGFPQVKARDLMDTQGPFFCYKYDN